MYILACENGLDDVFRVARFIINLFRFIVPIVLIILGSIDLLKAVIAGKEEDIKKNQGILIKRAIAALILFLVPTIVMTVMGWIGNDEWKSCWNSANGSIRDIFR